MIVTVSLVHLASLRILELGQFGHHLGHCRLSHLSLLFVKSEIQPTTETGLPSYTPLAGGAQPATELGPSKLEAALQSPQLGEPGSLCA